MHCPNLKKDRDTINWTQRRHKTIRYLRSLPAGHTYGNCHTFNWTHTELYILGQAQTKHAREFKEVLHSMNKNTINRHVDFPTIYLRLKKTPNASTNNNTNNTDTNLYGGRLGLSSIFILLPFNFFLNTIYWPSFMQLVFSLYQNIDL
jgi:hypothetical protein